jgi:hypothetical protein
MAKNEPIANISKLIEQIRKDFQNYSNISDNLPDASKGLSSVIKQKKKEIKDFFNGFPTIFFGKNSTKKGSKGEKAMDYGIAYLTALLASIDICSIIQTITNLLNTVGGSFNPNQNPPPNDPKWKIQKIAHDVQVSIDIFEATLATTIDPSTAILSLISEISPNLTKLGGTDYLGSPEIRKAYPQVDNFNNFIADTLTKYSKIGTISSKDKATINSILKSITLLRQICLLIQGLSSPASLVTAAMSSLDPAILKAINTLGSDNIRPEDISKIIASIDLAINQINKILSGIIGGIRYIQNIIKICLNIINIFKIIENFLLIMPMPNMYTTTGITTTFGKVYNYINQFTKDTLKLLNDINLFITVIISLIQGVAAVLDQISANLDQILENLKACQRNPALDPTIASLEKSRISIKQVNQELKAFVQNYQAQKSNTSNTYYGYTIQILTEEITDKAVLVNTIPRRYGIAVNAANIEVVKTDYTFASNDTVIVNAVKLLLAEKHLINIPTSALTNQETDIINQAMNALQDNNISMDNIPNNDPMALMDNPDNEDDNNGLGINAFFNKQKGGKKMRKKIKQIMNQSKQKLNSDLQNSKK